MAFIEPLNLEHWFVNVFAGTVTIFFYIAVACIFWFGAKFRMPLAAIFGLVFMFLIIMSQPGLITAPLARLLLIVMIIAASLVLFAILAREQK